jgi:KaiC/GvpD/RAD55 family RecA-like ATPase
MADYDFSTLNSTDLEELACDLLNAEEQIKTEISFRTFKEGKDRGIDLLYSTPQNFYQIVGQVKHYYRTGYTKLFNHLKVSELRKVKQLKPDKYIFLTSVDLSLSNCNQILSLFFPFIKNLHDIYGKKDLNRLLENHDHILSRHYKLWFCDTSVLQKLLNSEFEFRSSIFAENELKRRLRLYVETPLFRKGQAFLKENKFIIICGEPGVGKTTLAEMLIYEYIKDDYKFTYILEDIKEADRVLTLDNQKQILYFDDFLGSNAVEINKAKGSETTLRKILRRVRSQENKLIVLTTRSFLLNSAIAESENLRRFNINARRSVLTLSEYTKEIKREILNNHVEDCNLRNDLKEVLYSKEIANFVVSHENFTPRTVEFITTAEISGSFNTSQFKEFIFSSLNSSINIWEHAYSEQITEDDRLLLNTLLTFGESAPLRDLDRAFNRRIEFEIKTNNKTKSIHAFSKSLKRLEDGFIILKNNEVHFINPSLIDFLIIYLKKDSDEINRMINAICFVRQLTERFYSISLDEERIIPEKLKASLISNYETFLSYENINEDLIRLCLFIFKYIKSEQGENIVCEILEQIDDWDALYDDYSLNLHFKKFIEAAHSNNKINQILNNRSLDILTDLALGEDEIDEAIKVVEKLKTKFNINLEVANCTALEEHFGDILNNFIDQEIEWLRDFISEESEAYEKKQEINTYLQRIKHLGLTVYSDIHEFDSIDWYDIAMHNEFKRMMEKDD